MHLILEIFKLIPIRQIDFPSWIRVPELDPGADLDLKTYKEKVSVVFLCKFSVNPLMKLKQNILRTLQKTGLPVPVLRTFFNFTMNIFFRFRKMNLDPDFVS